MNSTQIIATKEINLMKHTDIPNLIKYINKITF